MSHAIYSLPIEYAAIKSKCMKIAFETHEMIIEFKYWSWKMAEFQFVWLLTYLIHLNIIMFHPVLSIWFGEKKQWIEYKCICKCEKKHKKCCAVVCGASKRSAKYELAICSAKDL